MMKEQMKQFELLARPLMKYLADNHNPHTSICITSTNAEILQGIMSTGEILDYIKEGEVDDRFIDNRLVSTKPEL